MKLIEQQPMKSPFFLGDPGLDPVVESDAASCLSLMASGAIQVWGVRTEHRLDGAQSFLNGARGSTGLKGGH